MDGRFRHSTSPRSHTNPYFDALRRIQWIDNPFCFQILQFLYITTNLTRVVDYDWLYLLRGFNNFLVVWLRFLKCHQGSLLCDIYYLVIPGTHEPVNNSLASKSKKDHMRESFFNRIQSLADLDCSSCVLFPLVYWFTRIKCIFWSSNI